MGSLILEKEEEKMEKSLFTFIEPETSDAMESLVCDPTTGLCVLPETNDSFEKKSVEKSDEDE